jgi:hypothetical protein
MNLYTQGQLGWIGTMHLIYISSVSLARLMTWLILWSGEVINNTIVTRATTMEKNSIVFAWKILYGACQYVLSALPNDSLSYHRYDFENVAQDRLLGLGFCLLPWIFTKEWWQKMYFRSADQWPTSVGTPISMDVPRTSSDGRSRYMDTLLTMLGPVSRPFDGRSRCMDSLYGQPRRVSIHLLRPSNNVRGTSVEIGVPTDVGHWSEQMYGHRFFVLSELRTLSVTTLL